MSLVYAMDLKLHDFQILVLDKLRRSILSSLGRAIVEISCFQVCPECTAMAYEGKFTDLVLDKPKNIIDTEWDQ
ncbi:uncharacterized protein CANTADRAFT_25461 [Suhomyces tanzawaensis NRRL Y-17324]|uniref:Uncharacterized protein n=1 Tax=Suhomyces tanzawaensis NRRL Y-17324 TaxID=984487 RepID=A0A1E4SP18_9ASCO|nr:uncharacterized protein CANTADRAFT_25461 [Suhomyces tanzawaensis NRRL Y-17324]ODV81263.1 hypothetical protein CANTADRAFT_25461 [Suhomyces tanzawaensis NRRL Y-17324]